MSGKKLLGKVVKISSKNTISVEVERIFNHKLYKKVLRRKTKYLVHDPENKAIVGDVVYIIESRPISKLKRWSLFEICKI